MFRYVVNKNPIPEPLVSLAHVSQSGNITFIGFSEYTSPSSPPKKYLKQLYTGAVDWCIFGSSNCTGNVAAGNRGMDVYSGEYSYNPVTGAITNTGNIARYQAAAAGACGLPATVFGGNLPVNQAAPFNNPAPTVLSFSQPITKTQKTYAGTTVCVSNVFSGKTFGTAFATLTDEDTILTALARAAVTVGSLGTAATEGRGAGDFTCAVVVVQPTFQASSLLGGINYRLSYDLNTEDYGGGNSVITSHFIDFVASGTTENITYPLDGGYLIAPNAKRVTIQNVTIAVL